MKSFFLILLLLVSGCSKKKSKGNISIPGYTHVTIELISTSSNNENNKADLITISNRIDYINIFPKSHIQNNILHLNIANSFPRHRLLKTIQPLFSIKGFVEIRPMMDLPDVKNLTLPRGVTIEKKCGIKFIKSPNEVFLKKLIEKYFMDFSEIFVSTIPIGDREFSGSYRELLLLGKPINSTKSGRTFVLEDKLSGPLAVLIDGKVIEDCLFPKEGRITVNDPQKKLFPIVLETILNTSTLSSSWKMGTIVSEYKN